jgi:hypothetical protein
VVAIIEIEFEEIFSRCDSVRVELWKAGVARDSRPSELQFTMCELGGHIDHAGIDDSSWLDVDGAPRVLVDARPPQAFF